eukprot:TRINITY_DN17974_c0_g3_i1.p1 TRINITY_DN17974_c0_g3~~TRINITY_DN17974_c0_g3_i1.p1  ORF type:complete len:405 (-),score=36.08 TRINITY_DN17974_c0_g3_i1:139-1353(-)
MKIVYITYEFSAGTFSGNGIYARTQVRAMSNLGHKVLVISAKHVADTSEPNGEGAVHLIEIAVPSWNKLDGDSCWKEFGERFTDIKILEKIFQFQPQFILGVDWTSVIPYKNIRQFCQNTNVSEVNVPLRFVFMNFRVFSRMQDSNQIDTVQRLEKEALVLADLSVVLCKSDLDFFQQNMCNGFQANIKVLLPPLRQEMKALPLPADIGAASEDQFENGRKYITCCVRLSEEKEPQNFLRIVKLLESSGELQKLGLTPLLIAGTLSTDFAMRIKRDFSAECPGGQLIERFLGPPELAEIFSKSLLNVHPCQYDAYGMTIIEAASQGCPSLIHNSGNIGATHLLSVEEYVPIDFTLQDDELLSQVLQILKNKKTLHAVGQLSTSSARAYTEKENGEQLVQMLQQL